jgi:hypothetical protein
MSTPREKLIEILQATRALVARPDNEFMYSGWEDADEALAAIDGHIARVKSGEPFRFGDISILYAPTGALQDLSISSGWSDQYMALASEIDGLEGWFGRLRVW